MCMKWSSEEVHRCGEESGVREDGEGGVGRNSREVCSMAGDLCGAVEGGARDVCEGKVCVAGLGFVCGGGGVCGDQGERVCVFVCVGVCVC